MTANFFFFDAIHLFIFLFSFTVSEFNGKRDPGQTGGFSQLATFSKIYFKGITIFGVTGFNPNILYEYLRKYYKTV